MNIKGDKLKELMGEIFYAVQRDTICHTNYIKKLRKIYENAIFEQFSSEFISNLRVSMCYLEKHPSVENTLLFATRFSISLQPPSENKEDMYEEMCPFLEQIFQFLIDSHNAVDVAVRFRVCYILNMLLDTMGENASIDDDLCKNILQSMLERIQDKSPKVRAQAAIALYRLQEPNNQSCPVIKVYIFHLAKDPSPEVRRVILAKMGKNKLTLHAAIKRIRDVDDSVRKMAYLFISKVTVKSLTLSQREKVINNGLQDKSDAIKKCVKEVLIPTWINYYDNDYIKFLKAIDAGQSSKMATLALQCLFNNAEISSLMEQLQLDDKKFIPFEQLSSESVLYWRCLAEYLKKENFTDEFEKIIPELSPFCEYIKEFINQTKNETCEQYETITQQFILRELFEMIKLYDLSDEMGRKNLKELILNTLQTYPCTKEINESIVMYFDYVVPDTKERIALLVEAINEIRMPTKSVSTIIVESEDEKRKRKVEKIKLSVKLLEYEDEEYMAIQKKDYQLAESKKKLIDALKEQIKELNEPREIEQPSESLSEEKNDPETIIRCLQIMYYMMQSRTIQVLSPALRTLMESIALPHINLPNLNISLLVWALKCVGLCCHVNKELAKKYLMIYFLLLTESNDEEVWKTVTEIIFDLLLKYGIEYFDITQDGDKKNKSVRLYSDSDEEINSEISFDSDNDVIKALISLLDSQIKSKSLQSVAAEGLCKLILHKRISSFQLISQLLILWYDPTIKNSYLSECLVNFFNIYVDKISESQAVLEKVYLSTLKMLAANATIDPLRISEIIISLTCYTIHQNYNSHNRLSLVMLNEVLNPDSVIEFDVLIKSLKFLDVNLESSTLKNDVLKAVDDVEKFLNEFKKKRLLNSLKQFKEKITSTRKQNEENEQTLRENEEE